MRVFSANEFVKMLTIIFVVFPKVVDPVPAELIILTGIWTYDAPMIDGSDVIEYWI